MPKIFQLIEKISGQSISSNPDVHFIDSTRFLIDEARTIRQMALRRPIGGGAKFFIMSVESFTNEASQALLKVFEEPSSQTHFFLLVPSLAVVLPTLRSRFFIISPSRSPEPSSGQYRTTFSALAKEFFQGTPAKRFKMSEELSDKNDDGENEIAAEKFRSFLAELEISLLNQPKHFEYLNDISLARKYLDDRSANARMIFEHLAIVLPRYDF